jgi:hypothetical protein
VFGVDALYGRFVSVGDEGLTDILRDGQRVAGARKYDDPNLHGRPPLARVCCATVQNRAGYYKSFWITLPAYPAGMPLSSGSWAEFSRATYRSGYGGAWSRETPRKNAKTQRCIAYNEATHQADL